MPLPPLPGEADYENVKDKAQKAIEASEVDEESELVYARCSSVQVTGSNVAIPFIEHDESSK